MSARTQGRTPEDPASLPTNTVHGYLAGVGAGAALLAAAVLSFMALVGMVSFNLWPQITPRGPGPATELAAPERPAVAVPTSLSPGSTLLASADPLQPAPQADRPRAGGDSGIAPGPPIAGEDPAPSEGERGTGGGDDERGSGGGSSQAPRGQGNAYGHRKGAPPGIGWGRGRQAGRERRRGSRPGDLSSRSGDGSRRRAGKRGARRRGAPARGPESRLPRHPGRGWRA